MHTYRISTERGSSELTSENNATSIFLTDIAVEKFNLEVSVISRGRFATPTVSINARSVGDHSVLMEQLKEILRLPTSTEIYTSTLNSMKILFWMGRSNILYFESDINDLIQKHSPDVFVIVDALMPFGAAVQNFRLFGFTGAIVNEALGENKAIWIVWKETTVSVLETRNDYSDIQVVVCRKNYAETTFNAVYGIYQNVTNDSSIRLPYCPITIPITENMTFKIYGECDEYFEGKISGVIQNCHGEWVRGFCASVEVSSFFHAQVLSLDAALTYLEELQWHKVTIETHSIELQTLVNKERDNMQPCCDLLHKCRGKAAMLESSIVHVSESKIATAIAMSNSSSYPYPNLKIYDQPPQAVQAVLQNRSRSPSYFI